MPDYDKNDKECFQIVVFMYSHIVEFYRRRDGDDPSLITPVVFLFIVFNSDVFQRFTC